MFQTNTVLLNFIDQIILKKYEATKLFSIIYIRMFSEKSCDTDWSNDAENTALTSIIIYIIFIKIILFYTNTSIFCCCNYNRLYIFITHSF